MYAIIEDQGRQYTVTEGEILEVDLKKDATEEESIVFERVLMVRDDSETRVGTPTVAGAKVVATVLGEEELEGLAAGSEVLAERISGARKVVIPEAGHMLPYEQPLALAEAVRRFLGRALPAAQKPSGQNGR